MSNSLPSVLIVDDNEDLCASLFDCFEENGFDCTAAVDPRMALNLAADGGYDIAVVDLHMPGMDGLTLFRQLRAASRGLVGILVTVSPVSEVRAIARHAGFRYVVQKPVNFPELLQLVREVCPPAAQDDAAIER